MGVNTQKELRRYLLVLPWAIKHVGGVNQVVVNLCDKLRSGDRYRPILLVMDWNRSKLHLESEEGFDTGYYRLRSPSNPTAPIRGLLLFLLTAPVRIFVLSRFLKKQGIEVVNPHYPTLDALNFTLLKYLRLFSGKVVLSFHGTDMATVTMGQGMDRILWKLLLRSSDAIVTCSTSLAQAVLAFSPGIGQKIHVVHNGVNIGKLTSKTDRTTVVEEALNHHDFILNVGTFDNKKGQDILLRAFQKIRIVFPNLRLVLIGRSGENESDLKRLADELEISSSLVMIKDLQHDRVAEFLEKASVFVLPSRMESFGIAILEAGAFGVPVVASAVGGVPEILEQGVTGYLIQPEDPSELADKILFLLRNPLERKRLGSNLQKHVREHFDWQKAYWRYIKIVSK